MARRVFAIAAHPDDIEFMMAGTLILLGRAGYRAALHDDGERLLRHAGS